MKKLLTIIAAFSLMLTACTIPEEWAQRVDQWKGHAEDDVYLVYGAPTRSQELSDGRKIATYDFERVVDGSKSSAQISFSIANGIVEKTSLTGDPDAVRRRIKGPDDKRMFD